MLAAAAARDPLLLLQLAARAEAAVPEPLALGAHAESCAVLAMELADCGQRPPAHRLLAHLTGCIERSREPAGPGPLAMSALRARGWALYARARLTLLFTRQPWLALDAARRATAAFEELSELRSLVLARTLEAACLCALGESEHAAPMPRDTLALAEALTEEIPACQVAASGALGLAGQPGLQAGSEHAGWPLHWLDAQVPLLTALRLQGALDAAAATATAALRVLDEQDCAGALAVPLWLAAAEVFRAAGDCARAQALHDQAAQQLAQIRADAPDAAARARAEEHAARLLREHARSAPAPVAS